tara:strand:- start:22707 stop:23225 length:519 start_codon:yes stop_codon:yes gene_type:complete
MHPSSVENMRTVKDKYLKHINSNSVVLDVGGRGRNVDRSYRQHFPDCTYYISDIQEGLNVTHLMTGPYNLPFDSEVIDLVVSGQMLEHCSNPFKSVAEMKRVLKVGGFLALIAPSTGPYHDSQDGWRFQRDAFKFISEDIGGIQIVADWITTNAPDKSSSRWNDHVFVGKKI